MISIQNLAEHCFSPVTLPPNLITQIDTLTNAAHTSSYSSLPLCQQVWRIIQNSTNIWENIYMLLTCNTTPQTRIQALILMEARIRKNWHRQSQIIRERIKLYLCQQARGSAGSKDNKMRTYFRKVNQVIASILKFEWNNNWKQFLPNICQTIVKEPQLSENYLDLLHTIFDQILQQQTALTREQQRQLKRMLIAQYPKIQKCFEKYISVQTPLPTLKNCIQALNAISEWIPAYDMTVGLVIDKLLIVLQDLTHLKLQNKTIHNKIGMSQGNKKTAVSQSTGLMERRQCWQLTIYCLLTIMQRQTYQTPYNFLPKLHKNKLKILQILLQHVPISSIQQPHISTILPHIFHSSLTVLKQIQKDNVQYLTYESTTTGKIAEENNIIFIFNNYQLNQQYQQIIIMLAKVLMCLYQKDIQDGMMVDQREGSVEGDYAANYGDYVGLFRFVGGLLWADRKMDDIVTVTPLPIHTNYYALLSIPNINPHPEDAESFRQVMKSIIIKEQDEYVQYVLQSIDKYFQNEQECVPIHKLLWNVYYYLDVCQLDATFKSSIFTIISRFLKLQSVLHQSILPHQPTPTKPPNPKSTLPQTYNQQQLNNKRQVIQKLQLLKPSLCMLLSHRKCLVDNKRILYQPFLKYICSLIRETNVAYLVVALDVLKMAYSCLDSKGRYQIHVQYIGSVNAMSAGQGGKGEMGLEVDLRYLRAVGSWQTNRGEQIQEKVQIFKYIINLYRSQLLEHINTKIQPKRQQQVQKYQQKFLRLTNNYVRIAYRAAMQLKQHIIIDFFDDYPIINQARTLLSSASTSPISNKKPALQKLYFKILKLSELYFKYIPSEFTTDPNNQNVQFILSQCLPIIAHLLHGLSNNFYSQDSIQPILKYLAAFLSAFVDWNVSVNKLEIVSRVVDGVFAINCDYATPGYCDFLLSLTKCIQTIQVPRQLIQQTLIHIFHPSSTSNQHSTYSFLQLLNSLLSPSSPTTQTLQQYLHQHILDISSTLFKLILQAQTSLDYISEYATLFMTVLYFPNRIVGVVKIEDFVHMMINTVSCLYQGHYGEGLMDRIKFFIQCVVKMREVGDFQQKLADLVVILRRGY